MIAPRINRVILYVKDVAKIADFYERFFGMQRVGRGTEKWQELEHPEGGCGIALHKAAVSQKSGAAMKVVFGVADIQAFKDTKAKEGLKFGKIWKGDGYEFANAKDPAGNSISISNRGLI